MGVTTTSHHQKLIVNVSSIRVKIFQAPILAPLSQDRAKYLRCSPRSEKQGEMASTSVNLWGILCMRDRDYSQRWTSLWACPSNDRRDPITQRNLGLYYSCQSRRLVTSELGKLKNAIMNLTAPWLASVPHYFQAEPPRWLVEADSVSPSSYFEVMEWESQVATSTTRQGNQRPPSWSGISISFISSLVPPS